MRTPRSLLPALAIAMPLWLAGCATAPTPPSAAAAAPRPPVPAAIEIPVDPTARGAVAPLNALRVAVYLGSPTSMVRGKDGFAAGVTHDLSHSLGRAIGMPVRLVQFGRVADVVQAVRNGEADFTITNATEARAREVDFVETVVRLELGYLVPPGSTAKTLEELDRPGARIGVSQGSTSQTTLPAQLKAATVVPVASLEEVQAQLRDGRLDAFATNKGVLFELADQVPGARVLDGRWGLENLAIAIPKGRHPSAAPLLRSFLQAAREKGVVQQAVDRAGLRGVARD